jgi:putative flippase GtrA
LTSIESMQAVRYLMAGALAAAANYGSRFVFSLWFPFEVAVFLAFLAGLSAGFVLMRHYAFQATHGRVGPQLAKYVAVNLFALVQTLLISSVLARWLLPGLGLTSGVEAVAHGVGVAVPVVSSYFGHKLATFK